MTTIDLPPFLNRRPALGVGYDEGEGTFVWVSDPCEDDAGDREWIPLDIWERLDGADKVAGWIKLFRSEDAAWESLHQALGMADDPLIVSVA